MSVDTAWRRQISLLIAAVQESDVVALDIEHGAFAVHIERDPPAIAIGSELSNAVATPVDLGVTATPVLRSPQVGTFYLSAEPQGEPFLHEGSHVEQGQVIGLIEAMKLISEVEADVSGVVRRVLVEDGQPVEYGQALFELE